MNECESISLTCLPAIASAMPLLVGYQISVWMPHGRGLHGEAIGWSLIVEAGAADYWWKLGWAEGIVRMIC